MTGKKSKVNLKDVGLILAHIGNSNSFIVTLVWRVVELFRNVKGRRFDARWKRMFLDLKSFENVWKCKVYQRTFEEEASSKITLGNILKNSKKHPLKEILKLKRNIVWTKRWRTNIFWAAHTHRIRVLTH